MHRLGTVWLAWLAAALIFGIGGGPVVIFIHAAEMPAFVLLGFPAGLLFGWLFVPREPGVVMRYAFGWGSAYLVGVCITQFWSLGVSMGSFFLFLAFVPLFLLELLLASAGLLLGSRVPRPALSRR